jgi:hypothetical protein
VGKPKGAYQILYERGLWVEGMKGSQTEKEVELLRLRGKDDQVTPPELDAKRVLSSCTDFKNEKSALAKLVEDRGHILLSSVVCHPEFAGCGIEYAWGKLKFEWRHRNARKDMRRTGGQVFIDAIKALAIDKSVLPMSRIWKYSRRARDYIRMYGQRGQRLVGADPLTHTEIERLRRRFTSHRCVAEFDRLFIRTTN